MAYSRLKRFTNTAKRTLGALVEGPKKAGSDIIRAIKTRSLQPLKDMRARVKANRTREHDEAVKAYKDKGDFRPLGNQIINDALIFANLGSSKIPSPKLSVGRLSKIASNSLENKFAPKPGSYSRALSEVKAGVHPPVKVRKLPSGKMFIEDGRHHLEAARRLGVKDYPIVDVTSKYRKPIIPTRGFGGRFTGSEAGFAKFPADEISDGSKAVYKNVRPSLKAIGAEGPAGKTLASKIERTVDIGEINAGKRMAALAKAPKMTTKERLNLVDVLEGRAEAINPEVGKAAKVYRSVFDDVAKEATESGVKTRHKGILYNVDEAKTAFQREQIAKRGSVRTMIEKPFEKRENYFPHRIPKVDDLKSGAIRKQVADAMVHRGVRATTKEAEQFIDEYVDFVKSGKQQDSLLEYMVDSGQAKTTSEALHQLNTFRTRTIKRGATETSRTADLPFYDPDPVRVGAQYVTKESKRLPQIREFGAKNEQINALLKDIRDSGGDYNFAKKAVDRILDIANEGKSSMAKVGLLIRTIQGFKLGLASIANMTQGVLNSLLKGDTRAVFAGLKGVMTSEGKDFALRSGATLESVLDETSKSTGALKLFLKGTGFTATERFNRRLAASAGRSFGKRTFQKALAGNQNAKHLLGEFGLDAEKVLKEGLKDDDVLMMAKKFTDITQFRSRPQDLPLFASSEAGKVFFQFKNFIYGQTRLMGSSTFGELRRGNFGRATRNLIVLSSVFPLAGEAVADIRSLITGNERDAKGLRRYFEDLGQVGALGLLYDAVKSGGIGRGLEYIVGPAAGDAGEFIDSTSQAIQGKPTQLGRFFAKRVPIVGSRVSKAIFPTKAQKAKSTPKSRRRRLKGTTSRTHSTGR